MITKVTIYGERCSGTTYLENIITKNFNVEITWDYGWKHFFGFNDLVKLRKTDVYSIIFGHSQLLLHSVSGFTVCPLMQTTAHIRACSYCCIDS